MFCEMGKEGGATTGHQVTQSDDGALSYSHARAYQLGEEAAENRLMEAHESSAQPIQIVFLAMMRLRTTVFVRR